MKGRTTMCKQPPPQLQRRAGVLICVFSALSVGFSSAALADGPPDLPGGDDPYPPWMICDLGTAPPPWCDSYVLAKLTCDKECAESANLPSVSGVRLNLFSASARPTAQTRTGVRAPGVTNRAGSGVAPETTGQLQSGFLASAGTSAEQ